METDDSAAAENEEGRGANAPPVVKTGIELGETEEASSAFALGDGAAEVDGEWVQRVVVSTGVTAEVDPADSDSVASTEVEDSGVVDGSTAEGTNGAWPVGATQIVSVFVIWTTTTVVAVIGNSLSSSCCGIDPLFSSPCGSLTTSIRSSSFK